MSELYDYFTPSGSTVTLYLLGASNIYLSYYIVKYHREHFLHHCMDSLLTSATHLHRAYRQWRPIPEPIVKITKIYLLKTKKPGENQRPSPIEFVNYHSSSSSTLGEDGQSYYHVNYEYGGRNYRIVLNHHQMNNGLLDRIPDEKQYPARDIDEVNFSHTQDIEALDLMEEYAGPLGDFYAYLDDDEKIKDNLGCYLLTADCQNYLLSDQDPDGTITVSDMLGDEYVFTL